MNRLVGSLVVIMSFALAGCGPSAPSVTPSSPTPAATLIAEAPSAGSSSSTAAGQTDTEWGRIWDTLPSTFPAITGATASEEAATGPASATMVVPGDAAESVANGLVSQLEGAGFPTEGLGSPLEGGAYVLDATGPTANCKVQVTVAPQGGVTVVTILYGAACPHE